METLFRHRQDAVLRLCEELAEHPNGGLADVFVERLGNPAVLYRWAIDYALAKGLAERVEVMQFDYHQGHPFDRGRVTKFGDGPWILNGKPFPFAMQPNPLTPGDYFYQDSEGHYVSSLLHRPLALKATDKGLAFVLDGGEASQPAEGNGDSTSSGEPRLSSEDIKPTNLPRNQATIRFDDLLIWVREELKGKQRRVMELTIEAGGECPLKEIAIDRTISWEPPYDDAFNGIRKAVNLKLNKSKMQWKLERNDNNSRLAKVGQK